jgi:hypothetical protein
MVWALSGTQLAAVTPSQASTATAGILPPNVPGRNFAEVGTQDNSAGWTDRYGRGCGIIPEQELPAGEVADCIDIMLAAVDRDRSYEGVGPMLLPSNWSSLTASEQQFVVIDLERVARGLPPFTGDSTLMDQVVKDTSVFGAIVGPADPTPPTYSQIYSWFGPKAAELSGASGEGTEGDPIDGIAGYMYDDGCGIGPDGGPEGGNIDCVKVPTATWSGLNSPSWGHREDVLMNDNFTLSVCPQGGCWVGVALNGGDNAISAWEEVVVSSSANSTTPATPTATFASSVDLYWSNEIQYLPACEQVVPADACTIPTTITAFSSNNNPAPGTAVTLTAKVSSTQGIPEGGSVSFADGSSPIAGCQDLSVPNPGYDWVPASVAITVTCTASFSRPGPHTITASYTGSSFPSHWPTGTTAQVPEYDPSTSPGVSINLPAQGAPGIVTNITATEGNASATINWSAPTSLGSSALTGYIVTASPGGETMTAPAGASSIDFTGLTNGTAYTFTVVATNGSGPGPMSAPSNAVIPSASFYSSGYWIFGSNASLYGFGSANQLVPDGPGIDGTSPVVGAVATDASGDGFYGALDSYRAGFGSVSYTAEVTESTSGGQGFIVTDRWNGSLTGPVVGLAPSSNGGVWVASSTGQVFDSGVTTTAPDLGSPAESGLNLAAPIVAMAATPDEKGYWLLGQDGGVFTYGDAFFYGSTGAMHLAAPIVAIAATADGAGYWLFAADGGVFTFGDAPFYGSAAGEVTAPVVAAAATNHPSP